MPGSKCSTKQSKDGFHVNPTKGQGNIFTFKRAKWPDPMESETDPRVKAKFGVDKTTNGPEHSHLFHAVEGSEHPKPFPQQLLACQGKALISLVNLNDRAWVELLGGLITH